MQEWRMPVSAKIRTFTSLAALALALTSCTGGSTRSTSSAELTTVQREKITNELRSYERELSKTLSGTPTEDAVSTAATGNTSIAEATFGDTRKEYREAGLRIKDSTVEITFTDAQSRDNQLIVIADITTTIHTQDGNATTIEEAGWSDPHELRFIPNGEGYTLVADRFLTSGSNN